MAQPPRKNGLYAYGRVVYRST